MRRTPRGARRSSRGSRSAAGASIEARIPPSASPGASRSRCGRGGAARSRGSTTRSKRGSTAVADSVLTDLASANDSSAAGARDEAVSLGVAGYETVGQGLAWCLLAVAEAPEVLRRLREEVDLLGDAPPTASDLDRLPYATACFEEAMRLRPPSWIVVRDVLREDMLPSGARLAPGARVYASQWVTHRDPRLHPEPERFDPERFLDGGPARRAVYAYFPFGAGPRDCIGRGPRDARGCARSRPRRPAHLLRAAGTAAAARRRDGAPARRRVADGRAQALRARFTDGARCETLTRMRRTKLALLLVAGALALVAAGAAATTTRTRPSLRQRRRRRTAAARPATRQTASRCTSRPAAAAATPSRRPARPAPSGRTSTTRRPRSTSSSTQVTNGGGAMPAFGDELSEQEIRDVAAFVSGS